MLVLDMIEIVPPLGKYKYDTWRTLPVKCYIDNFVCLWSCIRNDNIHPFIDQDMGISMYGSTPCPDLTWMTMPPEIVGSASGSNGRCTRKEYFHK
jgi:hypothetical protein